MILFRIIICLLFIFQMNVYGENICEKNNYQQFVGQLNQNKILMSLAINGNDIKGHYKDAKTGKFIRVDGKLNEDLSFSLTEFKKNKTPSGVFSGKFENKSCHKLSGEWSSAENDKKYEFNLNLLDGPYVIAGFSVPTKNVEEFAQKFIDFLKMKDKNNLASMICYPIQLKIQGKIIKIRNKAELSKNFDSIFSSKYTERVVNSPASNLFARSSGVMLGDHGEVWLAPNASEYNSDMCVSALNN